MHQIFQNFVDGLSSAPDLNGFRDAMAQAALALDLSHFAYLAIPRRKCNKDSADHAYEGSST
jgi:hypothetical protein